MENNEGEEKSGGGDLGGLAVKATGNTEQQVPKPLVLTWQS